MPGRQRERTTGGRRAGRRPRCGAPGMQSCFQGKWISSRTEAGCFSGSPAKDNMPPLTPAQQRQSFRLARGWIGAGNRDSLGRLGGRAPQRRNFLVYPWGRWDATPGEARCRRQGRNVQRLSAGPGRGVRASRIRTRQPRSQSFSRRIRSDDEAPVQRDRVRTVPPAFSTASRPTTSASE